MQRRPLSPVDKDPDLFQTPFERALDFFNVVTSDNRGVICASPLFHCADYAGLFQMIGFDDCPVHPKTKSSFLCPESAPQDQHATGFLQFGVRIENKRHVVFEMADFHYLIRFDFKESYPEGVDTPRYQIDELEIYDGGQGYNLDCEDDFYRSYITRTMDIVAQSMAQMAMGNHVCANDKFNELRSIVQDLNDVSERMEAQIAADEMNAVMQARASDNPSLKP